MKNNLNLASIFKPIEQFIRRFHNLLFFLLISFGLFIAILALMSLIGISSSTASRSDKAVSGSFDETTIKRLKDDSSYVPQPGTRSNPFVE